MSLCLWMQPQRGKKKHFSRNDSGNEEIPTHLDFLILSIIATTFGLVINPVGLITLLLSCSSCHIASQIYRRALLQLFVTINDSNPFLIPNLHSWRWANFSPLHFWHCFFSPGHAIVLCVFGMSLFGVGRSDEHLDTTGYEGTINPPGQIFLGIPLDLQEKRTSKRETRLNLQEKTFIRMTLRINSGRVWTHQISLCIIVLLLWLRRINHEVIYWLKDNGLKRLKEITP